MTAQSLKETPRRPNAGIHFPLSGAGLLIIFEHFSWEMDFFHAQDLRPLIKKTERPHKRGCYR